MEKLLPDEKYINHMAENLEHLISHIQKDIAKLKDKNSDVFERFMAFSRSRSFIDTAEIVMGSIRKAMVAGHCLQNKSLHTEMAKKHGWDVCKSSDHPFFLQDDKDDDSDEEMPDVLKKMIARAILGALK
jgi:hypothetical protein